MKKLIFRTTELLLSLAIALLLSSCANRGMAPEDVEQQAFNDFRNEIHETISDPKRAGQAVQLMDQLSADLHYFAERYAELRAEARELHVNYDSTRPQFESLFSKGDAEIRANQLRVRKSHSALLAIMTE